MQYHRRRQAGGKAIQTVSDRRRHDDPIHRKALDDHRQLFGIALMMDGAGQDPRRQRQLTDHAPARAGHAQAQVAATDLPGSVRVGDQDEVPALRLGHSHILDPAPHPAAPAMRDVQGGTAIRRARSRLRIRQVRQTLGGQSPDPQTQVTQHRHVRIHRLGRGQRTARINNIAVIDQKCLSGTAVDPTVRRHR